MRKPEWLFVIALLLVGVYFSYRYFSKAEKFDPLQLVPGSAGLVYEVNDPLNVYGSLTSSEIWQGLRTIEEIKQADNALQLFDSLIQSENRLERSLVSSRSLASIHVTGNESSGLMIYLPTGPGTSDILGKVLQDMGDGKLSKQTRVYNDYTIYELGAGSLKVSYILYDNYIIISTYGFLIEDVVRNINSSFKNGLFVKHANLYALPKMGDDAGNLYLNGEQLTPLSNTLLPPLSNIKQTLSTSGYLDVSVVSSKLFFSGFYFDKNQQGFVSLFKNQEAGKPESVNLVSENAAEVMLINVSDIAQWYSAWSKAFKVKHDFNNSPIQYLKGDMALATFYNNAAKNDKLLIARLADREGAVNYLNRKAEAIATSKNDTVYYERYAELDIGLIEEEEFVASFMGAPYQGFAVTYFTVYDNYLVMATTAERIKRWLEDIEVDLIWDRSVDKSEFIEENLSETSFALIYVNPWAWSLLRNSFNENTADRWFNNEEQIKQFGLMSFQFTNLDNRYYSEFKLEYNPQQVYVAQQELSDELLTQMTGRLITKPKLVRNHNNNEWEVLMQDSSTFLSLLDDQGELLWTDSLGYDITTDIYQVDFYKNRKLQYLFATDTLLHIIDRNGVQVEEFPQSLGDTDVKDLFLIDYDKSRNYRFLVSDNSGNLFMRNMNGEVLDGWNPLALNSEISDQVFHVRVRGKDRIVIGLTNGTVQVLNRRAEMQPGFPIDLEFNLGGPLHFKTGSTFESSRFTAVSSEGILVEFDLNGREYARRQVGEASSSANYKMIIDKSRNDLVIARQDINRLTIMKQDGTPILEKDFDTDNNLDVQYYYFGVDKRLYIVRDTVTGRIYLYNKTGTLVNEGTLFSDYPVSVVYRKKQSKCYIYTANNQSVEIKSFTF